MKHEDGGYNGNPLFNPLNYHELQKRRRQTMKKAILIGLCAFPFTLVLMLCSAAIFGDNKGIIALEGYGEAVAFCGNEFPVVGYLTSEGEAFFDEKHNITYVVNHGHKDDPQVVELYRLAEVKCAELEKEK